MLVAQLIAELEKLPRDKPILCQVVAKDGCAWNMYFDIRDIADSWMVQLRVDHPELLALPPDAWIAREGSES